MQNWKKLSSYNAFFNFNFSFGSVCISAHITIKNKYVYSITKDNLRSHKCRLLVCYEREEQSFLRVWLITKNEFNMYPGFDICNSQGRYFHRVKLLITNVKICIWGNCKKEVETVVEYTARFAAISCQVWPRVVVFNRSPTTETLCECTTTRTQHEPANNCSVCSQSGWQKTS